MTALAPAIERKHWQLVALRLLLSVSEAAHRLPEESLLALIDLLGASEEPEGTRGR